MSAAPAPGWFEAAASRDVVVRALKYAVGVGAILIAINHADALVQGQVDSVRLAKMGLTVMVPYCVSTASSVGALRARG
ncbi:MAG: nitrate/nitrite transporter NrtS [Deltaproteobacteria bacterium]|nr:nitrate/nitrite transporter NrtS [Deltaproteobacteria bacterium]MBW2414947.1 nitrate/nitrite transporter NrtS [Deltaproteobacteria bacterium]